MTHEFQYPELQRTNELQMRAAKTVRHLIVAGHRMGWFVIAGGCAVLAAYALQLEVVWRPIAGQPATHPLTALLFVMSGIAVCEVRPLRIPRITLVIFVLIASICLMQLVMSAYGFLGLNALPLLDQTLDREAAEGTPVFFGWNTCTMFFLVALAFILRAMGWQKSSHVAATFALALPLVALTGYAYGISSFHGEMSPTTALLGLILSSSVLLLGARTGLARPISSPWDGGRFGRHQILIIGSLLFLGGLAFIQLDEAPGSSSYPLFVIISIVGASVTIAYYSVAIERNDFVRRQAERSLASLVMTDRLTGFFNHRFFVDQNDNLCAFARREGYQVWVLLLDIDHFRFVNSGFNQKTGDYVLSRFAEEVRRGLGHADIAIRYEGKNGKRALCVLLNVDAQEAAGVAEKIRKNVGDLQLPQIGYRRITVSVGAARVLTSLTEAIGRADNALYLAKSSGRDRVVSDETEPGPRLVQPSPIVESLSPVSEFSLLE